MNFIMQIHLGMAATKYSDVAAILRAQADAMEQTQGDSSLLHVTDGYVRDASGSIVGEWMVTTSILTTRNDQLVVIE
jgi:hypothetical protein